jgi:hypothetical protein
MRLTRKLQTTDCHFFVLSLEYSLQSSSQSTCVRVLKLSSTEDETMKYHGRKGVTSNVSTYTRNEYDLFMNIKTFSHSQILVIY